MIDKPRLKQELTTLWQSYEQALGAGEPEANVDAWIFQMEELVPHAILSDLIFWGEKERSLDEAIDEAVEREEIYQSSGEIGLLIYLETQLSNALSNSALTEPFRTFTGNQLSDIQGKIAIIAGLQLH